MEQTRTDADAGRRRAVIEGVEPEIDGGRFPIKRVVGEPVDVRVDLYTDGHDAVAGVLRFRREGEREWAEAPLVPLGNDRWQGTFTPTELGRYEYGVVGWVDHFDTWRRDLVKRLDASQDVSVELLIGAELVGAAAERAPEEDRSALRSASVALRDRAAAARDRAALALTPDLASLMARCADRSLATVYPKTLGVVVEPVLARFGAWYELFPRSAGAPGRHGTLRDVEAQLPAIAEMGFDVLYLPPIHPIGRTNRKGRNNSPVAEPGDVGSPWAIGAREGGHTAVHPELGSAADLRRLVEKARAQGIEVALDVAFQVAPDHPWTTEHPMWFRRRPDGTIQYAENPPKKYEDIYPFDFETAAWRDLWAALEGVVRHWIGEGVRVFRVDNPHTKPFPMWEALIASVKRDHPEVIFLAEAFTRPKVMARLAKLGFSQSYTYYTWRNTRAELTEYLTQLTTTSLVDTFRPNMWPNTPDILPEPLQVGGRAMFVLRLCLAATLSASYGVYGPPYELLESRPRHPGSEEYADSEKYQLRDWDVDRAASFRDLMGRINRIRRENPALQTNRTLRFHGVDNEMLLAFTKTAGDNVVLVVANLDTVHTHAGWLDLRLPELGLAPDETYQVFDLLSDACFLWRGPRNYVQLDPRVAPIHLFRIRRRLRTERDFEYFL